MAVVDIAGFVADLKDHAAEHGFHVHDERHFVETYSMRQAFEVDLHPEAACGGPLDLHLSLDLEPRTLMAFEDEVMSLSDDDDPSDDLVVQIVFTWALPPLENRPDLLVLATELAGLGGPDLPTQVSAVDSFESVTDAPQRSLGVTARLETPLAALFRGDFYGDYPIVALVGWRDEVASLDTVEGNARALGRRGVEDRWVTHPEALWSFYVSPLAPWVRQAAPRNTLASPQIEFLAAARHAGGRRGKMDPLVRLAWTRRVAAIVSSIPSSSDPLYPDLPPQADRARRGGLAFQQASALYAAGRRDDAARALAAAADLLPGSVLADGAPDSSVADVWP